MNYSPIQLEAIKIFGRKDKTPGCIMKTDSGKLFKFLYMEAEQPIKGIYNRAYYIGQDLEDKPDCNGANIMKYASIDLNILGHIPHLEDVFRVAKEKGFACIGMGQFPLSTEYFMSVQKNIGESVEIDFNPNVSLLEQSEETLTQLINLFKLGTKQ